MLISCYNNDKTNTKVSKNQTNVDVLKLYKILKDNKSSLSSDDINILINDFIGKSLKIDSYEHENYLVEYGVEEGFNGLLVLNEDSKEIHYFIVNQPKGEKQSINLNSNMSVYYNNCKLMPVIKTNKSIEPNVIKEETVQENIIIENKLVQLERIEKLFLSGTISKEEMEMLKLEIIK